MTLEPQHAGRLEFLVRVVRKECRHLGSTDRRLFNEPFTVERAASLETDPDLAERVEAFVSRFGRLQDTLGDKLLPVLLQALGEKPKAVIDRCGGARMRAAWLSNWLVERFKIDGYLLTIGRSYTFNQSY